MKERRGAGRNIAGCWLSGAPEFHGLRESVGSSVCSCICLRVWVMSRNDLALGRIFCITASIRFGNSFTLLNYFTLLSSLRSGQLFLSTSMPKPRSVQIPVELTGRFSRLSAGPVDSRPP